VGRKIRSLVPRRKGGVLKLGYVVCVLCKPKKNVCEGAGLCNLGLLFYLCLRISVGKCAIGLLVWAGSELEETASLVVERIC